ncbi:MAG: hypothetical protein LUD12_02790 [Lachnospiraceae bacterium]|nr:hypothetical protein [Lachnospiraceae bacterium]
MIIRSQDKKTIAITGAGVSIEALELETDEGLKGLIGFVKDTNESVDLGIYGTLDEATKIVGSIYAALKAGTEFYDMPDVPEEGEDYEHPEDIELNKLQEWGELSNRTANALIRGGYTTLKEAVSVDSKKLMKIRNIGSSSVCELRRVYEKFQEGKI